MIFKYGDKVVPNAANQHLLRDSRIRLSMEDNGGYLVFDYYKYGNHGLVFRDYRMREASYSSYPNSWNDGLWDFYSVREEVKLPEDLFEL